ncbi:hypothetical protein Bpfe_000470 [Biomphalaria pfeifferi]|uniref:Uncharacterized protein n=1 Tax=Biomphalaria pfeifferi TaxID=112525 RepID=A0AAD8FMI3_BIOPF|nr:hypothetical protein Bpfe_000470 [Biomphalaria pfeifferi]
MDLGRLSYKTEFITLVRKVDFLLTSRGVTFLWAKAVRDDVLTDSGHSHDNHRGGGKDESKQVWPLKMLHKRLVVESKHYTTYIPESPVNDVD